MFHHETLQAKDGVKIHYCWIEGPTRGVLLICPGFFQSSLTSTFQSLTRELAKDFSVAVMDFRGHGKSGGRYTFSAREWMDLEAVIRDIEQERAIIGILGFSLGGAIAILQQARASVKNGTVLDVTPTQSVGVRGLFRSLMLVSTPMAWEDIRPRFWSWRAIRTGLRGFGWGAGCRPSNPFLPKERAVDRIASLGGTPLLFLHAKDDAVISYGHSQALYEAALSPKRIEIWPKGGHAQELFQSDPEKFLGLARTFFQYVPALI